MADIQIPPEAQEAGAAIIEKYRISGWPDKMVARACFTAMVRAWEGVTAKQSNEHVALFNSEPALILPLPQQESRE